MSGQGIGEFFDDFAAEWVRGDPDLATRLRYFQGEEQDRLDRQITPLTPAYRRQRVNLAKHGLERLRKFDPSGLTEVQRISADLMEWQLKQVVKSSEYADYAFPLSQFNGANASLPRSLMRFQPIRSERDAENYIAKLEQVSVRMEEAISEAERIGRKGIIPPRYILDATIRQMQRFADPAPASNPFAATLAEKMASVQSIRTERREAFLERAERIVRERVYPAWNRAIALLESQLPIAAPQAGLSSYDGGAAAYAQLVAFYTTTDLTADEVHAIGLREVARIETQMEGLLRESGRVQGTIPQRMAQLREDHAYPEPSSDESRAQIIADITSLVRDAEKRAESLFDIRPRSPVVVQPSPTFIENNTAANYTGPAADGSRPGIYQYPRRLDNMSKAAIRSVTYHETVPGHHFQVALQIENQLLPRFRREAMLGRITAFGEGWGLYAERLAVEEGWYEGDPEGLLDALDSQLFRARRLVVDTGLHAKGWTRQQAIDYGMPVSEVERYVVLPGQACAYMIGQLKLVELREKARAALGDDFSIREFHNLVLGNGRLPLELLAREVDRFVSSGDAVQ